LRELRSQDVIHPTLWLRTRPGYRCGPETLGREEEPTPFALPKLFKIYLRLGSLVISEPALDSEFKTVDFLIFLDGKKVQMTSLNVLQI
jgi:putative hemolysin